MSSPAIASTAVTDANMTCEITIPLENPQHLSLITLGTTYDEQIILVDCCHLPSTTLFPTGPPACLAMALCDVKSCSSDDRTYACIMRLRDEWNVQGPLSCEVALSECDKGAEFCESTKGMEVEGDWAAGGNGSVQVSGGRKQLEARVTGRILWAVVAIAGLVEVLSWIGAS